MATIYNVEITSHWISYPIEDIQKIIEEALNKQERDKGNTISVEVIDKK